MYISDAEGAEIYISAAEGRNLYFFGDILSAIMYFPSPPAMGWGIVVSV